MTEVMTVEQRLAALEKEVADLKQRLVLMAEPKKDWIEQISGSWSDIPKDVLKEYHEICAEIKQEGRPIDDE